MICTKLDGGECERGAEWPRAMHKKAHTLVSGSAPVAPVGGSTADQHMSQRNMRCTHTTRLHPALQDPTPHVSDHPLASSGHTRRSPASSPQQQLSAHAPAARAAGQGSQTGSWPFPHCPTAPPPLEHAAPWTTGPTTSTVPSGAQCSHFLVEKAPYRARGSITARCTFWRKSCHRLRRPAA